MFATFIKFAKIDFCREVLKMANSFHMMVFPNLGFMRAVIVNMTLSRPFSSAVGKSSIREQGPFAHSKKSVSEFKCD